jgi:hypothetical protein
LRVQPIDGGDSECGTRQDGKSHFKLRIHNASPLSDKASSRMRQRARIA